MRCFLLCVLAVFPLHALGCGTVHNLKDAPQGTLFMGTGCCYPMGGVTRSGLLAVAGPPIGLLGVVSGHGSLFKGDFTEGFQEIGWGAGLALAGVIAWADVPLSLIGDLATHPIAVARCQEKPWATWWGEKSRFLQINPTTPDPTDPEGKEIAK